MKKFILLFLLVSCKNVKTVQAPTDVFVEQKEVIQVPENIVITHNVLWRISFLDDKWLMHSDYLGEGKNYSAENYEASFKPKGDQIEFNCNEKTSGIFTCLTLDKNLIKFSCEGREFKLECFKNVERGND